MLHIGFTQLLQIIDSTHASEIDPSLIDLRIFVLNKRKRVLDTQLTRYPRIMYYEHCRLVLRRCRPVSPALAKTFKELWSLMSTLIFVSPSNRGHPAVS